MNDSRKPSSRWSVSEKGIAIALAGLVGLGTGGALTLLVRIDPEQVREITEQREITIQRMRDELLLAFERVRAECMWRKRESATLPERGSTSGASASLGGGASGYAASINPVRRAGSAFSAHWQETDHMQRPHVNRAYLVRYFRGFAPKWLGKFPDGGLTPEIGDKYDRAVAQLVAAAVTRYSFYAPSRGDLETIATEAAVQYLRGSQSS